MKRWVQVCAAIGAMLVAGCAGTDETAVNPTDDPGWSPENPDFTMSFDDFPGEPVDVGPAAGFISDAEREQYCADHGEDPRCDDEGNELQSLEQPVKHCYTGPGFAVLQQHLGNTNRFAGPCYERNANGVAQDCAFPGWFGSTVLRWRSELGLINNFCNVGQAGANLPGISPAGKRETEDAFLAWKSASGANLRKVDSTESPIISVGCAPAAHQLDSPGTLGSAGPWGPLRVNGPVSKIGFTGPGSQNSLDSNFPLANPVQALAWDSGIYWWYDRNMNSFVQKCGGTTTQKNNKYRTMLYLVSLHEVGHILGFAHTTTGIMKKDLSCSDLGDGSSSTAPRISVPGIYGDLYANYINSRNLSAVHPNWFADNSFCVSGPKPLSKTSSAAEFDELVQNN